MRFEEATPLQFHQRRKSKRCNQLKIYESKLIRVFVDDDPWTINDCAMAVSAALAMFIDFCSPMRDYACGFSFAGGQPAGLDEQGGRLGKHL